MANRSIGALAAVRREERPFALLMFSYFFLVITSFWILKPLKKSIFVEFYDEGGLLWLGTHLDAAQAELLAKVLNMVVAAAAVAVFSLLAQRLRRERLSLLFVGCFVAGDLLFSTLLVRPGALSVWSFYLYGDLFATLMVATFFAFLNDSVSPEGAKRLYGLVGLGGVLGGGVGSSLLGAWISTLDVTHWLWICAGLALIVGAVAFAAERAAERLPPDARAPRAAAEPPSEWRGLRAAALGARLVLRSPYLLSIAGIVAIYEVASTMVDFQFTATVSHSLDGAAIGRQLSRVFAITNAVSVIVQLFLTSYLLTRFGVPVALLVLPATMLMGSVVFLASPSLWSGSLLNTADFGFSYSVNQSAKEALYVPATADEKYHAKAFIDMFVQRFAKALGAAASLAITAWFASFAGVRWLSLGTLALLAVWLPTARYAGRRFRTLASHRGRAPAAGA